jgi:UPF0271 protein
MELPVRELAAIILYQVGALPAIAVVAGQRLQHVKLHGALANMASESDSPAETFISALQRIDPELRIMAMASTALGSAAALGASIMREVDADRAHNDDATLVARSVPESVFHDAPAAAERVHAMVRDRAVVSVKGTIIPIEIDPVCIHGDNPGAVAMARPVRDTLVAGGAEIGAPTR